MIQPQFIYELFAKQRIDFYAGVPDSLLKDFCAYVTDHAPANQHLICANEGNALAVAAGYHLGTGKIAIVYMQNSGLGNAVNPLASLVDKEIYSIPVLLLIGWRGKPGVKDEPQHSKQGRITLDLLKTLEIPFSIFSGDQLEMENTVSTAVSYMQQQQAPYAIVVPPDIFERYDLQTKRIISLPLRREEALKSILSFISTEDIIISTTGKASREVFELRESLHQSHQQDFLTVGSMGHASSIALGIALQKPARTVYGLDGDGAALMHLGALSTIGKIKPANFKHIIINNFAHESVGGQPTAADSVDFPALAKACGYQQSWSVQTAEELRMVLELVKNSPGPVLLEVKVNLDSRSNLGRPTRTPQQNKEEFMQFIRR